MHDPDDGRSNPSRTKPFREVLLGRREAVKGLAASALLAAGSSCVVDRPEPPPGPGTLGFTPVGPALDRFHHVADGYRADILLRWGDPLFADSPPFDPERQSAAAQEKQFGYNNDFLAFMPLPLGSSNSDHGLLCANHEYTNPKIMWPGSPKPLEVSREQAEIEMAAHGHSVVEVVRERGRWKPVVGSPYNRRLSLRSTRLRISGPAAGDARMKTADDPTGTWVLGLLNN